MFNKVILKCNYYYLKYNNNNNNNNKLIIINLIMHFNNMYIFVIFIYKQTNNANHLRVRTLWQW